MVRIPAEIKAFLEAVRDRYKPEHIYLFGSRAKGTQSEESDWDFIIVARSFRRLGDYDRAVRIHELATGEFAVDVVCLTPDEFEREKQEPSLVRAAIRQNALVEVQT